MSGDPLLGNFTSRAIDDSEWWALTWIEAYDLTGQQKYLNMAVKIADYVQGYWDDTCGGGVWWNAERTYKNAITNGLYIRMTAELHNRLHGDRTWLDRSQRAWDWFTGSGMINSDNLVNDGLDNCKNNGQTVWSYNQGLAIGAAVELWRATSDDQLLHTARKLADAAINSDELTSNGILTESCDADDKTCDDNGKQFKGIFLRYFADLAETTQAPELTAFVAEQADTIWGQDRDAANRLGTRWSGAAGDADHPNAFDWRTQASALSALIADVPRRTPARSLSATMDPAQPVIMPGNARTAITVDLAVTATATRSEKLNVRLDLTAPKGWTARSAQRSVLLRPHGNAEPVRTVVPVKINIPAGVADGHYTVTVEVSAGHGLSFTAQTDVLIASKIDFDAGTAAETPWLYDADGSQSNQAGSRFADGNSHFSYRFPFPADSASAKATLDIDNEYTIEASADGKTWTALAKEDQQIHDGENRAEHTVDLTPYLGIDKVVYLRVGDSFPNDGWGGRMYHLTATASS
ncbi:glycoside hydrolase family 76 protein [Microlunatus elymi]|uniref:glycoside hydrolase family 76 protein n=1 Tax=Microlunatus elymi TaxID=2596828 RepID=UPI001AEF6EF1|nr:glycoside hydrolase family 76 protein [Microlunatus elymi]